MASAKIEEEIIDLTLSKMTSATLDKLKEQKALYRIRSAYPLSEKYKKTLIGKLADGMDQPPEISFEQESQLLAGIEITCGAMAIQANLRDELKYFAVGGPV